MATKQRLLIKFSTPPAQAAAGQPFALETLNYSLKPLFAPSPPAAMGVAPAQPPQWYLATPQGEQRGKEWDAAHALLDREAFAAAALPGVELVEPDLEQKWIAEPEAPPGPAPFAAADACQPQPESDDYPLGRHFAWHLQDGFSGLKSARDAAGLGAGVVIVHLDTGYDKGDGILRPKNLDLELQKNFVDGEYEGDAHDPGNEGFLRQPGHGSGTLSILAGNKFRYVGANGAVFDDFLGGAPLATIAPVRIANSVIHLWTSSVVRGLDYARQLAQSRAEPVVVSMSMGGVASAAWADAVNAAYEAGVVIVCAAGNNFGGMPTRSIVYPARFRRVLAACGVTAAKLPYFGFVPWLMQGNFGPPSKMNTALSAFTPNIAWAQLGCEGKTVHMDGGGTSSATPQVAAAAALWLAKHNPQYPERWQRVEAVRKALFESADSGAPVPPGSSVGEMLGKGRLRAKHALGIAPAAANALAKTAPDSASFAWLRVLTGLGVAADDPRFAMLRLEMTQLAQRMKTLEEAIGDPDLPAEQIPEKQRRRFIETILDSREGSLALNQFLGRRYGRSSVPVEPPRPKSPVQGQTPRTPRHTPVAPPAHRRLRIFALDPGASARLDTAFINQVVAKVPWERSPTDSNLLRPGPVGSYLEVVDIDPASGAAYLPVDLNDQFILAEDGLAPSEGDPRFHQQMVYAVAMKTIKNFELALGRAALWATKLDRRVINGKVEYQEFYVPHLRIYPHALRQDNAFYSPDKVALLFGYFPAKTSADGSAPGQNVFTCLSHDIIAHETTHALLDGLHRRFKEPTNPDVFAFHEAFADIVAIFQHFTFPDLLRHVVRSTRGELAHGELLADLARQFGQATGRAGALRSAIGRGADPAQYAATREPHDRGAILVAAVFDAFLKIYKRRTADLFRLATGGTGVLRPGAIHPDLVERLAKEAAKTSQRILTICIRALDYMPPVDIDFSDYLRALITADHDLVPDDTLGYRVAFIEAFQARGIDADSVRSLAVDSLRWQEPVSQPPGFDKIVGDMDLSWDLESDRLDAFRMARENAAKLHAWIKQNVDAKRALHLGLDLEKQPKFEVHSVRPARRVASNGSFLNELVIVITQRIERPIDGEDPCSPTFWFRGGATWLVDARHGNERIRYAIMKSVRSDKRLQQQRKFKAEQMGQSLSALYFGDDTREPFALLHSQY